MMRLSLHNFRSAEVSRRCLTELKPKVINALDSAKNSGDCLVFASLQGARNGQRLLSDVRDCYVTAGRI